ncbi:MAG: hypothetical protein NTZ08_03535 [Verrucomicrobia bacterium]|nr:hypothetical protein [Verrucomicrobiota bacterium]
MVRVYRTQSELGRVPSHHEEGGAAQKRDSILVFSVHATLTKTLPNNPKIRRSLPKVGGT